MHSIPLDNRLGSGLHVLHHEPVGLRLVDAALEFRDQVPEFGLVPVGADQVNERAERLTRRTADQPVEAPGRRMALADIAAENRIGAAHDEESFLFECHVEKADAGETAENYLGAHGVTPNPGHR